MHIIVTLVGYFVFAAAVGAMAPPIESERRTFYGWFFRFTQILAANLWRLAETRLPGLPNPLAAGERITATASSKVESVEISATDARTTP